MTTPHGQTPCFGLWPESLAWSPRSLWPSLEARAAKSVATPEHGRGASSRPPARPSCRTPARARLCAATSVVPHTREKPADSSRYRAHDRSVDLGDGHAPARVRGGAHMASSGSLILLPDDCSLLVERWRKKRAVPTPVPPPPSHPAPPSSKGFKQKQSTYRISAAPSGRARCRRCRAVIAKGETRLEVSAFVKPGRYTLLLRCTAPSCMDAPLAAAILSVYKRAERVPVEAALDGSAEARRVVHTITFAGRNAQ